MQRAPVAARSRATRVPVRRRAGHQTRAMASSGCPFCAVIDGSAPAHVVLADEVAVAFLDRRPVFKGHVLVVPREHAETLADLPLVAVGPFFERVQRISAVMPGALGCDGTFVAVNNVVSQSVAHLHTHVVPRRRKDGLRGFFWPRTTYADDADAEAYAAPLRAALS
ncbi:MAG: histidine triad protein [Ilumatobacteraceae bacterium]|nr:histidine triad protein [Ilumatobacteraceae bacterium]